MTDTTIPEVAPWAVRFVDGLWEVTCSDGSLGGRFLREGDARVFADVAGPGPMTIASTAELERLRGIESAARLLAAGLRRRRYGSLPMVIDNALYDLESRLGR